MTPMGRALLLTVILVLSSCREAAPGTPLPIAGWIWARNEAPSTEERRELLHAGISRIYWQIGELGGRGGRVRELATFPLPAPSGETGPVFVPVIRIASETRLPADLPAREVAAWAKKAGVTQEVQFDYDCPERLLPDYARWLRDFRQSSSVDQLSTTALGGWAITPGWREVEKAVDMAFPMLYDVLPEVAPHPDGEPDARPIVEAAYVTGLLRQWSDHCRVPWQAGLPNFTRLSLFRAGRSLGQIRSWTWEALAVPGACASMARPSGDPPGVAFLRVENLRMLGGVPLQEGDLLAVKTCDPGALGEVLSTLPRSKARGIVWFQMPRPGMASNGWSLPFLASKLTAPPRPILKWEGNHLLLENAGDGDYAPVLPQGHVLRLTVAPGSIREILPGDFDSVEPLREGRAVPLMFASEICFRFTHLPAQASRRTGVLVLADPVPKIPLVRQATVNDALLELTP